MVKLSYRRLFAWAVLCCTLSALCGFGRASGIALTVTSIFLCPFIAYWLRAQTTQFLSLTTIIGRLFLALLPLFSFAYAAYVSAVHTESASLKQMHRINTNAWFNPNRRSTIGKYCGKRLVLNVLVERVVLQKESSAQIIIANCINTAFPEERAVDGRACFVVQDLAQPVKTTSEISTGDSLSVACYLRSSRFSAVKKTSASEEICNYLEQHKKGFEVFAFVHARDLQRLPKHNGFATFEIQPLISLCRERIFAGHEQMMGSDKAALLSSIVLGQSAVDLPKNIVDSFRNCGLSHIVAASGFNLTIVIAVTYLWLRLFNLPGGTREYACLVMLVAYVLLAGLSASIARAALVTSIVLLSRLSTHRIRVVAALAASLIVTWLPSPQALLDVGLQLSYCATAGIMLGAKSLSNLLNSRSGFFWQKYANTLSVTLVAQLFVLPVQLFYFGTLGLAFLPANLLVVPLIELMTIAGFLTSIFILIGSFNSCFAFCIAPVVGTLDWGLQFLLAYILWLTSNLGSWQWTQLQISQPSLNAIAAYYALVVCAFYLFRYPDKKHVAIALIAFATALISLSII